MTTEFDEALQAVVASSKGGIPSGTKIKEVAQYCVSNVKYESVLIQKLYLQFRKAPAGSKIGLLYVVDLILRDFLQSARKDGQDQWAIAPDGSHMAGFNRMKEILPPMLNDVMQNITEDYKEKVKKLIDIWERGNILSAEFLAPFKSKLSDGTTTPTMSPPPGFDPYRPMVPAPKTADPSQNAQSTASILQALAQMAKQKPATGSPAPPTQPSPAPSAAAVPPPAPVMANSLGYSYAAPQHPLQQQPSASPTINSPQQPNNLQANFGALLGLGQQQSAAPTYPPMPQQPSTASTADAATLQAQQLALLQLLMQQPQLAQAAMPQLATLFAGMGNIGGMMSQPQGVMPPAWQQQHQSGRSDRDPRDRMYSPPPRSPPRRDYRGRTRSRSPAGARRSDSPPRRRHSPVYGEYDGGRRDSDASESRGRGGSSRGARGRFGNRKASPHRRSGRDRSKSPVQHGITNRPRKKHYSEEPPNVEKLVEQDPTVGPDKIKVYSRTLFVGGVTGIKEDDLRDLFSRFGYVQSCILNTEKRHAFIKMYTREDAIAAKEGLASYKFGDITIRTRWGVGFGPRECTNYESGISVIPLDRLTDADKRWVVSANYGGTGGLPLRGGIAIEEPDIEIGAGVSSKAISKRHEPPHRTDKRKYSDWDQKSADKPARKREYGDWDKKEDTSHALPPATPSFGGSGFPLYGPGADPYQTAANLSNYFYGNQGGQS